MPLSPLSLLQHHHLRERDVTYACDICTASNPLAETRLSVSEPAIYNYVAPRVSEVCIGPDTGMVQSGRVRAGAGVEGGKCTVGSPQTRESSSVSQWHAKAEQR